MAENRPRDCPTGVPWEQWVRDIFNEFKARMEERFEAQKESQARFAEANKAAMERLNEFRQAMTDRDGMFASSDSLRVIDTRMSLTNENNIRRIEKLEQAVARFSGKEEQKDFSDKWLIAIIGVGLAVVEIVLHFIFKG